MVNGADAPFDVIIQAPTIDKDQRIRLTHTNIHNGGQAGLYIATARLGKNL